MSIKDNLSNLLEQIPEKAKLVAVSKTMPNDVIMEAYNAGQRLFGENKVQELTAKQPDLPPDIEWHFIGHLQRNKVKYIADFVSMIHAVDSLRLLKEINKQAERSERVINCLLQFHIAEESTKFGMDLDEGAALVKELQKAPLNHVRISGVMGMGTFTDDMELVRKEFQNLRNIFEQLKTNYFAQDENFKEISMGMSNDFQVAIEEGSTIIRIGSTIFGERNY